MSNYIKTTNFAAKDSLPSGNPAKIVKGTEINTEFDNIAVASATKLNSSTVSTFGATLIDDANASAARTTLGLGTAATTASTDYATAAQGTTADAALPKTGGAMTGAITTNSTFDGVDVAVRDGVLTSTTTTANAALPKAGGAMTGAITTNSTFDGRDVATDGTKLDGIEASADVTDTANVTAAGALMDSEVTNLAQVKAFDSTDYATAAQGTLATAALPKSGGAMTGAITTNSTFDGVDIATRDGVLTTTTNTANAALPKAGGAMTGAITTNSTFDGRDVATDGTKLDGIEASADVTDTTNVVASLTAGSNITIAADGTIASTASGGGGETLQQTLVIGNTVTTDTKIQFRDTGLYINSSVDGQLDIVADTEIQIAATTVDLNGVLDVSGNIVVAGTVDGVDIATRDGVLSSTTTTAGAALPKSGGTMSGVIAMGTSKITGAGDPTAAQDVATKAYVDSQSGGGETLAETLALGNRTAAAGKIEFRDAAIYINSSVDGQLDIVADTEVQLAATTFDILAAVQTNGDVRVGDDLSLLSDSSKLNFGLNSDVSLTHQHNLGLLLNTNRRLYFYDTTQYIHAPSSTTLDINATSEIELNAALIDVNGNLDVQGTLTVQGGITEDASTLSGTTPTLYGYLATNFVHTLTGATTYTFSNPATTGNASSFTLKIIQDSTARTITWPATVRWAGGTAPTLTTTANGVDVFVFYTIDGGTNYYGFTAGQAMA